MAGRDPNIVRAACVQMRSGRSMNQNVDDACGLIRQAAEAGAQLVLTPETTHFMELSGKVLFANVRPQDEDPGLKAFCELAQELSLWLVIGSLSIRVSDQKVANRSFVIDSSGQVVGHYDKIHMFDVDLPSGESYRESKNFLPGDRAIAVQSPWGKIGLTICYDLRFPYLYRALAQAGAAILTVPAAFTKVTGEAHWHTLLRARAIETGCFVLAPAQGGTHENGRETYGHSLIVAPWGEIVEEAGVEPGIICADLDMSLVDEARGRIPSLHHDRHFVMDG